MYFNIPKLCILLTRNIYEAHIILKNNQHKQNSLWYRPSVFCEDKKKQTLWPLVRKRTIPTDRPPPVSEI
jgi:hypothetical protein